jgi:PEP-CTERM motif
VVKLGFLIAVCLLLCATGAKADSSFSLTATGNSTNISLSLTGTAVSGSPGVFDITSLSGTVDGVAATLLPTSAPGTISYSSAVNSWLIEYDNVLNMNGPGYLDLYGLGFSLSDGVLGNLYYSSGYLYAELGNNPPDQFSVSVTVADPPSVATPEPGTLALLISGLVGICVLALRKQLT